MNEQQFKTELNKLGIILNDHQLYQLEKYYQLLIEWNQKMNLTAITKKEDVYLKHFYDSLTIVKTIDLTKIDNLCDIGTGAGFPAVVLKILFPKLKVTLVDSLNKRILFLNEVIKQLGLVDIEALHQRAEIFALKQREKFSVVTARAVAPLNILSEYCLPLVKINGYFIAMKGDISREIKGIDNVLNKLDSRLITVTKFLLPYEKSNRTLIKIKKLKITNKKYPRKFSEIKKKPLS